MIIKATKENLVKLTRLSVLHRGYTAKVQFVT